MCLGRIHVAQDVLGCQCRHEFSDSNSWTASTDALPKELRWPQCTYWRLGWCNMPRVPVLAQRCGCCQVVVNWYWMLCHTQCIHNLAWNEQWSGTASIVCLCPLPTSSVQPLGWDREPLCTEPSVHWCAPWRRGEIPPQPKEFRWFLNWQECVTYTDLGGSLGFVSGCSELYNFTFMDCKPEPIPCCPFLYGIYCLL